MALPRSVEEFKGASQEGFVIGPIGMLNIEDCLV